MAVDPGFGSNDFNQPKMYNESETLAHNILTVIFGRPGAYPTMPKFGMYIQGSLMKFEDEIDVEGLKSELMSQCSQFREVVMNGSFDIKKKNVTKPNGEVINVLGIKIPTITKDGPKNLLIGITRLKKMISFNYDWVDA